MFNPRLVAAVGAVKVETVPVDRAAATAADEDGVYRRLFADAQHAAAAS